MRIAVYHNLPPGGAKRVVYEEIKYLSRKHELDLYELSSTDKNFLDIRDFVHKHDIYKYSTRKQSRLLRDFSDFFVLPTLLKKMAQDIDSRYYDVVLVHPDRLTQAPFLLRYLKTPSVYFCEELLRIVYEKKLNFEKKVNALKVCYEMLTRKLRKQIDKKNARAATQILVASKYIQKKVKLAYGRTAGVCSLGADLKLFRNSRAKRDQILFIGDEGRITGYDFAQEVFKRLDTSVLKLKTVGFKKGQPQLTDPEMAEMYQRSFLTLCVSYNEPFGLVALESMASGTPVLAVNQGGYRETIVNEQTGYLLPRQHQTFVEKIEHLLKKPQHWQKLSRQGREHVVQNFTWLKHNQAIEKILCRYQS